MAEVHLNIEPMTIRKFIHCLDLPQQKRVSGITEEFLNGFCFIHKYQRSVTFFGSARLSEKSSHYEQARELGKRIVEELHYAVVTGGGPGIMEAANRGALEGGGDSVGLAIELPNEQVLNPYTTDHISFNHFFVRKVVLSFAAEAYVFFPGGFGTLDEVFEILTLVQTRKIPKVPIVLVGKDFWRPLNEFIAEHLLNIHHAIDASDMKLYTITDNNNEVIEIIRKAPVSRVEKT